jgi:hypothetical protein
MTRKYKYLFTEEEADFLFSEEETTIALVMIQEFQETKIVMKYADGGYLSENSI